MPAVRTRLKGGVYIGTGACDEFLDMGNLILLFVVCFNLICFEFIFCADVGVVVTTVVDEFAVDGKIHDLITDVVEKVLGVGCEDETMRIFREICLEPYYRFKVQMVCRFVEQQEEWFNEQCLSCNLE